MSFDAAAIDLTPDGGVRKHVVVEGDGDEAGRGARVSLKYSLYLTADFETDRVDSSEGRPNGVLSFTLGRRKVLPGLEILAQSMKVGEKSRAQLAPVYAFGDRGLKRKGVPPQAHVFLEAELVAMEGGEKKKPVSDMSSAERFEEAKSCKELGNDLFKEVKYERAEHQYKQCLNLLNALFYKPTSAASPHQAQQTANGGGKSQEVQHNDGEKQDKDERPDSTEAEVPDNTTPGPDNDTPSEAVENSDEEEAIETLDVSMVSNASEPSTTVSNGEAHPFVEEEQEVVDATAHIPNGGVTYTSHAAEPGQTGNDEPVVLNGSHGPTTATEPAPTPAAGTTASPSNAEAGSSGANETHMNSASETAADDPTANDVQTLRVTTHNNLALCYVKMEKFKKAAESATWALAFDPNNSKALYYRGKAQVALGEWEKAMDDLNAAAGLQPNNVGIRMEITKLQKKQRNFENLEKKQAAAMFA